VYLVPDLKLVQTHESLCGTGIHVRPLMLLKYTTWLKTSLSSNYWGGIAVTEGWAETPGVHLELLEHPLLIVGKVSTPQDAGRLRFHCL